MRTKTSAISVPVSLIYAAAALSTGQPIIIALGVAMVVVAAGYLASELMSGYGLPGRFSASPARADERPSSPDVRQIEVNGRSVGERVLPAVFVVVTLALTISLAAHAAAPFGN